MKNLSRNLLMAVALILCGCSGDDNELKAQTMTEKVNITIDGVTQQMTLVDNAATRDLVARLQSAPVTVTLNSSGGFEIWGALGFSLPTSNQQVNAQPGDVVLYNGSNICLMYGSNSWSYTRLGHIDGLGENELRTFLKAGESNIRVTLSVGEVVTGISQARADSDPDAGVYYDLNGLAVNKPNHGIYIRNGKKVIR